MPGEDLQQARELVGAGETGPRLDRQRPLHGVAQGSQQVVDAGGIAQQGTAGVLAANDRGRAAEVEVDAGGPPGLELAGSAHQIGRVPSDHLGDHRPSGRVFLEAPQDVAVGPRPGVDPEILGDVPIGATVPGHQREEGVMRDVLHRRQHQGRPRFAGEPRAHRRDPASVAASRLGRGVGPRPSGRVFGSTGTGGWMGLVPVLGPVLVQHLGLLPGVALAGKPGEATGKEGEKGCSLHGTAGNVAASPPDGKQGKARGGNIRGQDDARGAAQ